MSLTLAGWIKTYFASLLVFFAVDLLWLGVVAQDLYQRHLGHMLKENVNWGAALVFYLLFVAGVVFFVVQPAAARSSLPWAIGAGALFGLVTYAAYDLTNLALTRDFPLTIALIDLAWGATLCATVSTAGWFAAKFFAT